MVYNSHDSEDDFHSGCRNVSHCLDNFYFSMRSVKVELLPFWFFVLTSNASLCGIFAPSPVFAWHEKPKWRQLELAIKLGLITWKNRGL